MARLAHIVVDLRVKINWVYIQTYIRTFILF